MNAGTSVQSHLGISNFKAVALVVWIFLAGQVQSLAQPAELPLNPSSEIKDSAVTSGFVFLSASDWLHGQELWAFNTAQETITLLRDIAPGKPSSTPENFYVWGDTLFFVADDQVHGRELWRSDGTSQGTWLLRDIRPGPGEQSDPKYLCAWKESLYFLADDGTHGPEMWISDGTTDGTILFKDIHRPNENGITAAIMPREGFALLRAAPTGLPGELWITDGTPTKTQRLAVPGLKLNGFNVPMFRASDCVLFVGFTDATGDELWRSDGTRQGTYLLKDILTGPESAAVSQFANLGRSTLFAAKDAQHGLEIWRTDGTPTGTTLLLDIWPGEQSGDPYPFREAGKRIYFTAQTPDTGRELWTTDGTPAGTHRVTDLRLGSESSTPYEITPIGGNAFFSALADGYGEELFFTDGTPENTRLIKDINSGPESAEPNNLVLHGDKLYFSANDGKHGAELWRSDGTAQGTELLADIALPPAPAPNSDPHLFTVMGVVCFVARSASGAWNWWQSDGSPEGTLPMNETDISLPAADNFAWTQSCASGSYLMILRPPGNAELWLWPGGTEVPMKIQRINRRNDPLRVFSPAKNRTSLYYPIQDGETMTLYQANTETLAICQMPWPAFIETPFTLATAVSSLHFTGYDPVHGVELWIYDGKQPRMVADIRPGAESSHPQQFRAAGDTLYFTADDGAHGAELWTSGGSAETTRLFADTNPVQDSRAPGPAQILDSDGSLIFFTADDGEHGRELWKGDISGHAEMLKDIFPGRASSNPDELCNLKGRCYFRAESPGTGVELFCTDGTAEGTRLVHDLLPGPPSSSPRQLHSLNDYLFFTAASTRSADGTLLRELWSTDGDTLKSYHISPQRDICGSQVESIYTLYFAADSPATGRELWKLQRDPDTGEYEPSLVKDIFPSLVKINKSLP